MLLKIVSEVLLFLFIHESMCYNKLNTLNQYNNVYITMEMR